MANTLVGHAEAAPANGSNRGPLSELGPALKRLREKRRMTQAQVAESMGTTSSAISEYEGGAGMNTATLDRYLFALGAHTGDLARELGQEPDEGKLMRFFLDLRDDMLRAASATRDPDDAGTNPPQRD